jgi:hypothetical protein
MRLHSWYVCGWCEDAVDHVCGGHRCHGITAAGTRCKKPVSDDNPMYCKQHQCTVSWVLDGERIACTLPANPQALPDGRRLRVCDQHHQMMRDAARRGPHGKLADVPDSLTPERIFDDGRT